MSILPYFGAAAVSSALRIVEKFLSTSSDAERYFNHEINLKQATDGIVNKIHIYIPLTTAKLICDTIVLSMSGKWIYDVLINIRCIFKSLINCGFEAFQNGIKLSLNCIFNSLRNCTVSLILSQFKRLYDKPNKIMSSFSIYDFCNMSNHIHFLIIATTNGFTKTIQLELIKYWLECMGIIRAIAESHNIDFIKYMNKYCSTEINVNCTSSSNNDQSFDLSELQWARVKDSDFTQIITVSLEDIFHGTERDVIVKREIREIDKRTPEIEEARYKVTIEPGCADRKTFRFNEAGHRDPVNIPGDLIVEIQTDQHQLYERSGSNLIYKAKVSLEDALRGTSVQVPLIDGRMQECNPRGVIKPNTQIIIDQAGLPVPTNDGIRGCLIVQFDIEFPDTKLSTEPIER